jgi:hypothetical protein
MATKKQNGKRLGKSNRTRASKVTHGKRKVAKKGTKILAKPKTASKKAGAKSKSAGKRELATKTKRAGKKQPRQKKYPEVLTFSQGEPESDLAGQAGDLQGLSSVGDADSESVDELLEEGNAFEADVVKGVEDAGDRSEKEVRTHEVPEDDVPGEYLDQE